MTELFWISYVALAVTVIILCIAMVFIYRLIGRPALLGMTPLSWPLTGLRSGDPLPSLNATALLGPTLHGIPEDGFLVLTSPASGFAATLAVAITASAWQCDYAILARSGDNTSWCADLPDPVQGRVVILPKAEFDRFGASEMPVVLSVLGAKIVDAIGGLTSPRQIKDYFNYVETVHRGRTLVRPEMESAHCA